MKFSVIIPVYNKAETLLHSVESVLNQLFKDFEIIIINDGSTDNFFEIKDTLASCNKITIIEQPNSGVSAARNMGIMNATGEYICFLDADDIYLQNHLQVLKQLIDKYPMQSYYATSHFVEYSEVKRKDSSLVLINYSNDFLCDNLFFLLNKNGDGIIHTNSICIKKEAIISQNVLFEYGEKVGEDTDVWYRMALHYPIVISKEVTTVYRRAFSTATAKTSNTFDWKFARREQEIKSMEISAKVKKECLKLIDRYKMKCSRDYIKLNDKNNARKMLKKINYKTKKYYLSLILCWIPYKMTLWIIGNK